MQRKEKYLSYSEVELLISRLSPS